MIARARKLLGWAIAIALIAGLGWHWMQVFAKRAAEQREGVNLVVFGPSSWDTLVPGASPSELARVTQPLDEAFRREHPQVGSITHDSRGTVADGVARLRNAYVAGNQVDVVLCAANPVNTSYARLGLIQPIDGLMEKIGGRFTDDAIDNLSIYGKRWGAPLSAVNISTFYYNRTAFARAGVAIPSTYDEFLRLAPKLKSAGLVPIIHQGKNAWMWTPWYFSALVQTSGGNHRDYLSAIMRGEAKFTDEVGVKALKLTRRWIDAGLLDPGSSEMDEEGMKAAFLSGRAASFFGGTWDFGGVRDNAKFDWGMFPYPKLEGQPGRPRSFGGAELGLCLAANTPNRKLAMAYIEFMTREANARKLFAPLAPFATSHREIAGLPGKMNDDLRAQLPAEKPLEWMFPPEVNDVLQRELQAMMSGYQTPEATAASIQRRFDALMRSGNLKLITDPRKEAGA